ncbi:sensor domain-containing diguanylate cyclase [Pseudohongiella sp. O18]|uniref:GGDEF domain-containing protein n=1 Tax=Pseudohongiella sp. O18 TaxID=2904248 RepID=UPI001F1FB237|nr:GGDEF domain-containing protein [Pseudohongiella sp. O18]
MIQLDLATLALMFLALGITSFFVMFLIWRINRDMPGVMFWMLGTLLNITSAMFNLLNALLGWSDGWGPFTSNTASLTANLLIMEGTLRFRNLGSTDRWSYLILLIPVFVIGSWLLRLDPGLRYIFHDGFTLAFQLTSAIAFVWRTSDRHEFTANSLAAVAGVCMSATIAWRFMLALTSSESIIMGPESTGTQWYVFAGANFHVAWIFGLSVACYFRSRQQVMQLAREDALTGLPNRRCIDEKLNQTLLEVQRSGEQFATILIDLNDFKTVNDHYGHSSGDTLLVEFTGRLREAVRTSDFAGRYGGDEFLVIARQLESRESLDQLIERLRDKLNSELRVPGGTFYVVVSIGAAVCPVDGTSADELLGAADSRMYSDKARQKAKTPDKL